MKVSIIIPAYNEEATIGKVIDKVISVDLPSGLTKEIVVVNDGSTDDTLKILQQYAGNSLLKIINQPNNKGKTKAIVKGLELSTGDIFLIQDADLEYDPQEYPKLLAPILEGKTPIVYGSRFRGSIRGMTVVNRTANIFSNIIFNLIYGVRLTDINTCYKVFKKHVFEGITIESDRFTFETEITAKFVRRGHMILEVPIRYVARSRAEGKKITWKSAFQMFWGMIKYRN